MCECEHCLQWNINGRNGLIHDWKNSFHEVKSDESHNSMIMQPYCLDAIVDEDLKVYIVRTVAACDVNYIEQQREAMMDRTYYALTIAQEFLFRKQSQGKYDLNLNKPSGFDDAWRSPFGSWHIMVFVLSMRCGVVSHLFSLDLSRISQYKTFVFVRDFIFSIIKL